MLSHDRVSADVDAARIRAYVAVRCRDVVDVPHDPHLASGGRIEPARLRGPTSAALRELAALVADRFAAVDGPGRHPAAGPTLEG